MAKLQLALKAEYFDAIKAGTKQEEYRLANAYWTKRLNYDGKVHLHARSFSGIVLTKGYPKAGDPDRTLELPWRGFVRKTITHPHFGPDPVEVFAIDVSSPSPQSKTVGTIDCPCTTFEQDEDCKVGYPSLLCTACDGKGIATVEKIVAFAAEMMKVAEQVGELEDPFAAWESISLIQTQNMQMRRAIGKIADMQDAEDADLDDAILIAGKCREAVEAQDDG